MMMQGSYPCVLGCTAIHLSRTIPISFIQLSSCCFNVSSNVSKRRPFKKCSIWRMRLNFNPPNFQCHICMPSIIAGSTATDYGNLSIRCLCVMVTLANLYNYFRQYGLIVEIYFISYSLNSCQLIYSVTNRLKMCHEIIFQHHNLF